MNTLPFWLDWMIAVLILAGAVFSVLGSFGLARLGTFMKRLHGPTKAVTLGVGCILIASAAWFAANDGAPTGREILLAVFLFLTAPVSGHMLAKAAARSDPDARPPE